MNWGHLDPVLSKYRRKGLLIDSNLLLLLFVGRFAPEALVDFKLLRNQGFTLNDFERLRRIASLFSKIIVTPQILTEVSNQCGFYKGRSRAQLIAGVAELIQEFTEENRESKELVRREDFAQFGLTDCAITSVSSGKYLVLTKDFDLCGHLRKNGVDVINFTHLRNFAGV